MNTCKVVGCPRESKSKGYCPMHYARVRRTGTAGTVEPRHAYDTDTCTVEECAGKYRARGYCSKHYQRLLPPVLRVWDLTCHLCGTDYQARRKTAKYCPNCRNVGVSLGKSPENLAVYNAVRSGSKQDVLDAILGRCKVTGEGCWEWQGHRSPAGYGRITTGREKATPQESTHRVTYEYATGTKPEGMSVHHKCANAACCNPDHLQLATQRDNIAEMHARKSYEAQIDALRKALSEHAPEHPLLIAQETRSVI